VSQAEIDALKLKAEKATLDIEQAREDQEVAAITKSVKQTELEGAKVALEQRMIVAPWAGMVVQVHRRVGDYLQTGDKVARLVRLDKLRIETYVREADLVRARVDAPIKFTLSVDKQPVDFEGKIVFVSPEVDAVNGQVKIYAEVDNPDLKLRPGQRGKLTIGATPEKTARK
jgi:RND family efflux transporter MFP subunit